MSLPSIYNDVLGPVMRGPSSSHSAGSLRIGRIARMLLNNQVDKLVVDYDPNGSLVTTHTSQGTDMGLYGGLMGWEADDERLIEYKKHVEDAGLDITVNYISYGATHPNTYRMTVSNSEETLNITGLSTGGGMIEIVEINGCKVSMAGDFYETLIFGDVDAKSVEKLLELATIEDVVASEGLVRVRSRHALDSEQIECFEALAGVKLVKAVGPVLPILGAVDLKMPFDSVPTMVEYAEENQIKYLWELAVHYEAARGGISHDSVLSQMKDLVDVMLRSVARGLEGTEYEDRILPNQSSGFAEMQSKGGLIDGDVLNQVILQVSALMENKSSMGVLVAAPTAGSCGACPGAILGAARIMRSDEDTVAKAMLSAGIVGVFIAKGATFAAEEAGCMAECGAGSSMAAAGLVTLMEGSYEKALGASSMALQNCLGMVCDPIANRVEAPCLGKNVLAATNALSSANMALANYNHIVPLDEVIDAMTAVGKSMVHELCCTGLGGLAVTPTAKRLEASLEAGESNPLARCGTKCQC